MERICIFWAASAHLQLMLLLLRHLDGITAQAQQFLRAVLLVVLEPFLQKCNIAVVVVFLLRDEGASRNDLRVLGFIELAHHSILDQKHVVDAALFLHLLRCLIRSIVYSYNELVLARLEVFIVEEKKAEDWHAIPNDRAQVVDHLLEEPVVVVIDVAKRDVSRHFAHVAEHEDHVVGGKCAFSIDYGRLNRSQLQQSAAKEHHSESKKRTEPDNDVTRYFEA